MSLMFCDESVTFVTTSEAHIHPMDMYYCVMGRAGTELQIRGGIKDNSKIIFSEQNRTLF